MNIVLIGHHGCGKTTIGKILADQLWKQFVDADTEQIGQLLATDEQVIGLPAEALARPSCRKAVEHATNVTRIYLKCQAAVLHQRLVDSGHEAAEDGVEAIVAALAECESAYQDVADHVFDVTDLEPAKAVRFLIQRCL